MTEERSSAADVPPPFIPPSPEDIALLEAANGLRQFDRLAEMIEEGISGRFRLRPSQLQELNRIAVEGLTEAPGSYRPASISISGSSHQPPPFEQVPSLVEELCDHVNDHLGDQHAEPFGRLCDVAVKLDPPFSRWKWTYLTSSLLSRAVRQAWYEVARLPYDSRADRRNSSKAISLHNSPPYCRWLLDATCLHGSKTASSLPDAAM